mgnify:CR=1 FL=1
MIATLNWFQNLEPDFLHYNVYWGTRTGIYTNSTTVTEATHTISNLRNGVRYYFAVSAEDTSGNESDVSEEVSKLNKVIRLRM